MTAPILTFLLLFVLQSLLAPSLRYLSGEPGTVGARLRIALGPRDAQPPLSPLAGRAHRAFVNLQEAMPVFLSLALLHALRATAGGLAVQGAWLFLAARALYVPAYLSGVPGVRSAVWAAGAAGLACMAWALR